MSAPRFTPGGRVAGMRRSAVAVWSVAAVLLLAPAIGASSEKTPEGNPFRGRQLLSKKLCVQCHSVWGHGGQVAPDMSTAVAGKSRLDLVGDFWNHTPRMIDAMAKRGHDWPTLDQSEMGDLLSYLYYLRLFDEPGDALRGSIAYTQHRCARCHTLAGKGGLVGGPLDRFSAFPSAVMLIQAMWNAGPKMQREQIGRGTEIPIFSGAEMADLQAYIRQEGIRSDQEVTLLPLPDPSKGAEVFRSKRCVACHRAASTSRGPDLTSSSLSMTVSEIGGALWNHSYAMNDTMRSAGIPFPQFKETEMADLISHLYFLSFVGGEGDPVKGASVFKERGCARCHEGAVEEAIDLANSKVVGNPIALSAAMWNHAPEMHALMAEQAVAWPKLDQGDMVHLSAYLRVLASSPRSGEQ